MGDLDNGAGDGICKLKVQFMEFLNRNLLNFIHKKLLSTSSVSGN